MTLLVCLCDFLALWMSVRLCPSILTPHFLWQQPFLSQVPVENVTMEESKIQCFHNHTSLLQWLKVKHPEYTGFCMAAATITVSGWCPGKHLLLFPFVLHRSLCFTVNCLGLRWGICLLKIDIMVFSPFSVLRVKQKEGVFSCFLLFLRERVHVKWYSGYQRYLKGSWFHKVKMNSKTLWVFHLLNVELTHARGGQNPSTYCKNITSSSLLPEATQTFHYISASRGVLFITILPCLKMIPSWL